MRKLIILLFLFPFFLEAQSQEPSYADSLSYAFYNQKEYKALKVFGKECISKGQDFFYLRLRLGVVAFKENNFEEAWVQLEKAEQLEAGNEIVIDYLYWSYRYTGQEDKANALYEKYRFIASGFLPGPINTSQSELEAGFLHTSNKKNYGSEILREDNFNTSFGNFFSSMYYARLYHELAFKRNYRLFAGIGVFGVQNFTHSDYSDPPGDPNMPLPDSINKYNTDPNIQINLGGSKLLSKGFKLAVGIGYFHERFTSEVYENNKKTDTKNYLSSAFSLSKRFKYFEPVVLASFFDFVNFSNYQVEAGISCYPIKGSSFYSFTTFGYSNIENSFIFKEKVGYSFKNGNQLEVYYLMGGLDNYMGNLGFITLNTFDPANWVVSAQYSIRHNKLNFIPGYQIQARNAYYSMSNFSGGEGNNITPVNYDYLCHLFYLTLRYTPQ